MPIHAMLDIETLSTSASATVLSAAVVFFDPETGEIVEKNMMVFDALRQNRHIDVNTIKWWMKQPAAASEHWRNPSEYSTVESFARVCSKYGKVTWWALSPTFDEVIMTSLFADAGVPCPWTPWVWLDVRTIKNFLFDKTKPKNANAHNPVEDCLAQIELVVRFYREQAMVKLLQER